MKAGTFIRLPDGRDGTVVYNGLDGVGIMWGHIPVDIEALHNACPVNGQRPADWPYDPEAMLREPSQYSAKLWPGMECVGEDFEIIEAEGLSSGPPSAESASTSNIESTKERA